MLSCMDLPILMKKLLNDTATSTTFSESLIEWAISEDSAGMFSIFFSLVCEFFQEHVRSSLIPNAVSKFLEVEFCLEFLIKRSTFFLLLWKFARFSILCGSFFPLSM